MCNLSRIFIIFLFAGSLFGCDNSSETKILLQSSHSLQNSGQKISLLNDRFTLYLPKSLQTKSGQLENQTNNIHIYANESGRYSVIILFSEEGDDISALANLLDVIELQLKHRDAQLQVIDKKEQELKDGPVQRLDVLTTIKGQQAYVATILGMVAEQLFTLQITLPANDPNSAEQTVEQILQTISIH